MGAKDGAIRVSALDARHGEGWMKEHGVDGVERELSTGLTLGACSRVCWIFWAQHRGGPLVTDM